MLRIHLAQVPRGISYQICRIPCTIIELWLLLPVVTQIEPSWVRLFDERNFPAAAPPVQFLLAPDRILHVAKVLKPNEPAQMIAFREALYLAGSMLAQSADD